MHCRLCSGRAYTLPFMQWEGVYAAAYAEGERIRCRLCSEQRPAAPQPCSTAALQPHGPASLQHCSPAALQQRSPTAPQSCSTAILQPRSPPAAQQPRVTPDALHKATRARCGTVQPTRGQSPTAPTACGRGDATPPRGGRGGCLRRRHIPRRGAVCRIAKAGRGAACAGHAYQYKFAKVTYVLLYIGACDAWSTGGVLWGLVPLYAYYWSLRHHHIHTCGAWRTQRCPTT